MNYSYKKFNSLKKISGKKIKVNVLTGSMDPWIKAGEEVTAEICSPDDLKPFDIILFWRQDIFICHLFIKTEDNFLITKPLLGKSIDPPSHMTNLLGKVTSPRFSWFQRLILKISFRNIHNRVL